MLPTLLMVLLVQEKHIQSSDQEMIKGIVIKEFAIWP